MSGTPVTGSSFRYVVRDLTTPSFGAILFGLSQTHFSLAPFGAPGCDIFVNRLLDVPVVASPSGEASALVNVPPRRSLVGARLFTQAYLLDQGAPTVTPIIASNGLDLFIGGDR